MNLSWGDISFQVIAVEQSMSIIQYCKLVAVEGHPLRAAHLSYKSIVVFDLPECLNTRMTTKTFPNKESNVLRDSMAIKLAFWANTA